MNPINLPLHRMCIDKSSCIAEQDENHTLTADLTKDVFRKQLGKWTGSGQTGK